MIPVENLYLPFSEKVILFYIHLRKGISVKDIEKHPIIRKLLRDLKLIEVVYENDMPTSKIVLSGYGKRYLAYRSEKRFDNLFIPVIVTILTDTTIHAIKWLLSLIL